MTRRVFVSDVHMSPGASLNTPERYEWFSEGDADNFLSFLKFLKTYQFDELVLLGDIMDDWLHPIDTPPGSFGEIAGAKHVTRILRALQELARQKAVTYVQGNHDMAIMDEAMKDFRAQYFPGVKFRKTYQKDGVFAQHGHQYIMWNAEDPTGRNVPIGYYITRLQASVCAKNAAITCTFPDVVKTLKESGSPVQQLVNAPINFLKEQLQPYGVSDVTPILGTGEIPGLSLAGVKKTYADLPDAWENLPSSIGPWRSVRYEVLGLWEAANDLAFKNKDKNVVIFGHTHQEDLTLLGPKQQDPDLPLSNWGIYANCGVWAHNNDQEKPYSYVVAEYDAKKKKKHTVTLNHWKNNKPQETRSEEF